MGSGKSKVSGKITTVKSTEQLKSEDNTELSKEKKTNKFREIMEQVEQKNKLCEKDPESKMDCVRDVNQWAHAQLPQAGGSINNYIAELNIDGQFKTFNIIQKGSGIYEAREIQSGGGCGCGNDDNKYIRFKHY